MKKLSILILFLSILFVLIGCNGVRLEQPTPLAPPTFTSEQPISEPAVETTPIIEEPTAVSPTSPPTEEPVVDPAPTNPTVTAVPAEPVESGPTRITFETGGTSATINGTLNGANRHDYLLRALEGQLMTIRINSPNNDVRLSLYGIDDGQPLSRANNGSTYYRGVLARTQDYSISAVYNGDASDYTITIEVLSFPTGAGIVETTLAFEPGSTGKTVTGAVDPANNAPDIYHVRANAGQTMFVSVRSFFTEAQPVFTVIAPTFGLVSPDGATTNQQQWAGQLPKDDTYQIMVHPPSASVEYVLDVQVIDRLPRLIEFPTGTTGTTVNGRINTNQPITYVLSASAGQEMSVSLDSLGGNAKLFVELGDRSAYLGFDASDNNRQWNGLLPASGAYFLHVVSDFPQTFTLSVEITTPPTPPSAANCPAPTAQTALFASAERPYCFLYPLGMRSNLSVNHGGSFQTIVFGPPAQYSLEPSAVHMWIEEQEPANGRSAREVAEERMAEYELTLPIEEIELGGETAVVFPGFLSPIQTRIIIVIHDNTVYTLTFGPYAYQTSITLPTVDELYEAVVDSFVFVE